MTHHRVPLPAVAADRSVTALLPRDVGDPLHEIAMTILDAPTDAERVDLLVGIMRPGSDDLVSVEAAVKLLTATLEQFGDRDISDVQLAMLYRVAWHDPWRRAAARWLLETASDPIEWMVANPAAGAFVIQAMSLPGFADTM